MSKSDSAATSRASTLIEVLEQEYQALHTTGAVENAGPPDSTANPCSEADRLKRIYEKIHGLKEPRSALCLSGGGIRSASFSLGVIQSLAQHGVLGKFDYLSTVSGGGYIGSWLSTWIHRHERGQKGVCEDLASRGRGGIGKNCAVEADPITYLRDYNNYLTPHRGLFSLDTWTLLATYLRNLLLNWMVLLPMLVGMLLIPYIGAALVSLHHFQRPTQTVGTGRTVDIATLVAGTALTVIAMAMALYWLPSLDPPKSFSGEVNVSMRRGRSSRRRPGAMTVSLGVLVPITLGALVWTLRIAWFDRPPSYLAILKTSALVYSVSALATCALAYRRGKNIGWSDVPRICLPMVMACAPAALASSVFRLLAPFRTSGAGPVHSFAIFSFGVPCEMSVFLCMMTLYVGFTSRDRSPEADDDREWWGRLMGAIGRIIIVWLTLSTIVFYGPLLFDAIIAGKWQHQLAAAILSALSGLVGTLGGYSASSGESVRPGDLPWWQKLLKAFPTLGANVFLVILLILLSAGISHALVRYDFIFASLKAVYYGGTLHNFIKDEAYHFRLVELWSLAFYTGIAIALACVGGSVLNVNRLSLHAIYRSRLVRAFLGASNPTRRADPFTGFDPDDNLSIHELRRPQCFSMADIIDFEQTEPFKRVEQLIASWRRQIEPIGPYLREQLEVDPLLSALLEKADSCAANWGRVITELGKKDDVKETLNSVPRLCRLLLTDPTGAARQEWGMLVARRVLAHLNAFTDDHELVVHTRYAEWVNEAGAFGARAPLSRLEQDIQAACRQFAIDHRPCLLNRLILEARCLDENDAPILRKNAQLPKPFHVLNLAMNLVRGQSLALQQRKAASFTVSPLYSGFVPRTDLEESAHPRVRGGFRPSVEYASGITIGTAMAISGAAASPNMGYHSSPAVTFLMTLFNVRLGWWLGNPSGNAAATLSGSFLRFVRAFHRVRDEARGRKSSSSTRQEIETWQLPYPSNPLRPLIDEALGLTTDDEPYVYLSDGGHFENLGLYEMVRRRCHYIVVVDATCDPECSFGDLGSALRNIRTDFGIPIEIDNVRFFRSVELDKGKFCAVGKIGYKVVDGETAKDGKLIYIKAALRPNLPVEVLNYSRTSKSFPHEPTANQWFTDAQFESYRRLGEFSIATVCHDWDKKELQDLKDQPLERFYRCAVSHLQDPTTADPHAGAGSQAQSPPVAAEVSASQDMPGQIGLPKEDVKGHMAAVLGEKQPQEI